MHMAKLIPTSIKLNRDFAYSLSGTKRNCKMKSGQSVGIWAARLN